jgi:hypothetical protein
MSVGMPMGVYVNVYAMNVHVGTFECVCACVQMHYRNIPMKDGQNEKT